MMMVMKIGLEILRFTMSAITAESELPATSGYVNFAHFYEIRVCYHLLSKAVTD